ncbi:MAG TPA: S-layer homology domain-containing protein [Clostridiales bacterium]|nr:S-layer homology domain-containing protein [Clostridiales bacterium]
MENKRAGAVFGLRPFPEHVSRCFCGRRLFREERGALFSGRYSTGYSDKDGGVAEIVAYNSDNKKFYLVNGREKKVDVVSLENLSAEQNDQNLVLEKRIDVSGMIPDLVFGDLTSIAVNTKSDMVAVAVQAADYKSGGAILILDYEGNYIAHYAAGVQPDMVTFSPCGRYVLTADEGEPREGYVAEGAVDPRGSVTIVDLSFEQPFSHIVTFADWDNRREELVNANVLLKKGLMPSVDLEPEYIVVSRDSSKAYVALQEANAIATLDIAAGEFTAINSLGFKDHRIAGNEIDVVRDDSVNIKNEDLMGVYMPDGISIYEAGRKTYLLTANEGDASEWGSKPNKYTNMKDVVIGKRANGKDNKVEVMDKDKMDGFPEVPDSVEFILGGRSFSIYEVSGDSLNQVFDSGSDFEKVTAKYYPDYFNASNKNNKLDSRSDAKGPEPEDVDIVRFGQKVYAYIGLERIGGVMLYDITNPRNAIFKDYINTRDFGVDFREDGTTDPAQGDVSPEGICAIPAEDSPTGYPLLLVANEVSGTVAVFQQKKVAADSEPGGSSGGGSTGGSKVKPEIPASEPAPAPASKMDFGDVKSDDWFYDAVEYVSEKGLMKGVDDEKFAPEIPASRGMIVTVLHRLAGSPAVTGNEFRDVSEKNYYSEAVAWAVANGIVSGYGNGFFGGDEEITREQLAVMLFNYAKLMKYDISATGDLSMYTDAGVVSSWAKEAMAWAKGHGIISGVSATSLDPAGTATRAQFATMLMRFIEAVVK